MKSCFFILLLSLPTLAQNYLGAVSSATAGTGRGAIEISDSAYINPAGLAYHRGYYFTTSLSTVASNLTHGSEFAVSLIDNTQESLVPTGMSYAQLNRDRYDLTTRDFRLSFGKFISNGFALGFALHHKDDQFPEKRYQQTNLNFGAIYALTNAFALGLTIEDLMAADASLPEEIKTQQKIGLGATYTYRSFARFRADLVSAAGNSFAKPSLLAGMESYLNRWLVVRFGLGRDYSVEGNLYSAGMGFKSPKFGLHYAYQSSDQGALSEDKFARHSIDLAIPLW